MNIRDFKKGDLIVRVEPGMYKEELKDETLNISVEVIKFTDTSYIGDPYKLLDICNGIIYLEVIGKSLLSSPIKELRLCIFSDGWKHFIVPHGVNMGSGSF